VADVEQGFDTRETERTVWGDTIPTLVRQRTMGFLVGNGLSRLSGAPGWNDLFTSRDVSEVLAREGVNQNTPYLELGFLLAKRAPVLWDRVLRRLYDWGQGSITYRSRAHRALLELLRPGQPSPPNVAILTTNVDPLLENYGYRRDHIGYIHGEPHSREKWIFTADDYWDSWNSDHGIRRIFSRFKADGVLFLGYGHSYEDFDIIQTVIELRRNYFGRMFTIMTREEAKRGDVRVRLDWQGIEVITYFIPPDPTPVERDLFLTRALLDLAEDCEFDRDPERRETYNKLREWCETEFSRRRDTRSKAMIVLGLAGINRHAALAGAIPSSERRVAEPAELREEPGGPGYIVSELGRATGIDSFLVSKIASDQQGGIVRDSIRGRSQRAEARIFPDFVEIAATGSGVTGFRTWDSFVLEPSDALSHRVFIDRAIDPRTIELSDSTKYAVATMLRDGSHRVFYFDRHYRDSIVHVLRSANFGPISNGVWTVYETDSDGGRYGFTPPGPGFDKERAYDFEKRLAADQLQCINVVAASFRFARDCLAVHYGDLPRDRYEDLISRDDSSEIVGSLTPTHTEDELIAELVQSEDRLNLFADAIRKGANRFLRNHPLRLVLVTLHRHGALAVTVPAANSGPSCLRYVPGTPVTGQRLYTASAGDVFRGVLVSALAHVQHAGFDAARVMQPDFLESLVGLCNRCASAKVTVPTLNDCLRSIRMIFDEWKARLPASSTS
jgi:hypothetical protein